jgi:hypothetical protein
MKPADIETRVDILSDALHRALATGDGRCWLLIDPARRPLRDEREFDAALLARSLFQAPSPTGDPDPRLMPLLVDLDSARAADSDIIRMAIAEALEECSVESLVHGAGRRICGWLESKANGPSIARHISRQLIQRRPSGTRTLLRWTDPAVLWALWPLLEPAQRKTLLGPIDTCWLLDPGARWLPLRPPADGAATNALNLSVEQWAETDAIRPLNLALRDWGAATATPDALVAARQHAAGALRRARALGFSDPQDLAAFAGYALAVHPRFDQHPLVRECLAKRVEDDYFTALVDDLKPEDWQRIRTESDAPPNGRQTITQ